MKYNLLSKDYYASNISNQLFKLLLNHSVVTKIAILNLFGAGFFVKKCMA